MRLKRASSLLVWLLAASATEPAISQTRAPGDSLQLIPVALVVKGIGKTEFEIISRESRVYIPIVATFKFLRLNVSYNEATGVVDGFYVRPDNPYRIDARVPSAVVGGKSVALTPDDFYARPGDFFLRLELFESLFGLELKYAPRLLAILLQTKEALPIFLEREREYARRRKLLLGQIPRPDYTAERSVPAFGVGRLDYVLTSQVTQHGIPRRDYSFRLGNQFLGGDLDTRFEGSSGHTPTWNDVTSRLRYAFLDNSPVKQIFLGDILTTGLVPSAVFGAEITNRPAPRRLLFVTETLDGELQTGELSDLYYGGSLIDFQAGTPAGKYSFPALISYGVTTYTVKKYDQFGVEHDLEYRIVVPPTMIPPGEIEYSLSGGEERLLNKEWYGDGVIRWGLNDELTIGGGVDYYSPKIVQVNGKFHPFLTSTARISSSLIGDFTFAPTAYSTALFSLSYPTSAGASLAYSWFARNIFYNTRNILNEATGTLSIPFRPGPARLGLDLLGRQTMFASGRERVLQVSLGGQIGIFSPRITHRGAWELNPGGATTHDAITSASLAIRAPAAFLLRATTTYFHTDGGFKDLRIDFSRRFTRHFWLDVFYDKTFQTQNVISGVQILYYFPFTLIRAIVGGGGESGFRSSLGVSGSVGYSSATNNFFFDYFSSRVGYGALIVQPFIDANGNGVRDPGEEVLNKARIRSRSLFGNQYLRYNPGVGFGLEHTLPYEEYVMTIEPQSLDNPLWVPLYENIGVFSEPNQFRVVDLPVVVGGIVRGKIEIQTTKKLIPGEGLTVILELQNAPAGNKPLKLTTVSFSTGEYEFIGMPPGTYKVSLDEAQVAQFGYIAKEISHVIQVHANAEGEEVAGVDFSLSK